MSQSLENPVDPGRIFQTYAQVLTNPSGFFRHLPLGGGLQPAVVFLGVSGLLSGLAYFVLAMLSFKPYQSMGQALFGIGIGLITVVIRKFGGFPEGVTYAILIMNIATPFLNKIRVRKYGFVPPVKPAKPSKEAGK